jgi:2-polyprenyl-3-methyl-5-hydroxy-6-metoxy-1,4-benzoquinol methylase
VVQNRLSTGPLSPLPPGLEPSRQRLPTSVYSFKHDPYSSHHLIPQLVRRLSPPGRVLDVGCDDGFAGRDLLKDGFQVWGVDRNPVTLRKAARYYQQTILADIENQLPLPEGPFNVIIFADILEHLTNPARVFTHFAELLAPDGLVIVSVPNMAHLYMRLSLLLGRFEYADRGILDRTHVRFFTLRTARRFLEDAGFTVEVIEATATPLPLVWETTAPGRPLFFLHTLGFHLARSWKTLFGYQLIFAARKR